MKQAILIFLFGLSNMLIFSQQKQIDKLPSGKYEAGNNTAQSSWNHGDLVISDDSHYKVSGSDESGEYKFSVTAQRVFFTSGPLKRYFARAGVNNDQASIIFPSKENQQMGLNVNADVALNYRK